MGRESYDDAGVYQLNSELALIQTVDFFTPMVDSPYLFGQIAAANALSDIYAMGGQPITALNIAAFPTCLDKTVCRDILRGGADKLKEAGALLIGGHTVEDQEPKFGLAVTGVAHPGQIIANNRGKPGDLLFLTKHLGNGIICSALKRDLVKETDIAKVTAEMAALNCSAARAMTLAQVDAATDITGFGLLGHLAEMLGNDLGAQLWSDQLPIWPQALAFAEEGIIPGGLERNWKYIDSLVRLNSSLPLPLQHLLFDPQTSGGLLMATPPRRGGVLESHLENNGVEYRIIGRITEKRGIEVK